MHNSATPKKHIVLLWSKYSLPPQKRIHVTLVTRVALYLAQRATEKGIAVDTKLLETAALLHDIDKNIPKLPGERHPDTGVRILHEEGLHDVAELVRTHPLHAILDPSITPKTWEQKLLYLSDKMVKYEVITLDERFKLWNDERLPAKEQAVLDAAYPLAKQLEREIFSTLQTSYFQIHKSCLLHSQIITLQ